MRILTMTKHSLVVIAISSIAWSLTSSRAAACSCLRPTVGLSYDGSSDVVLAEIGPGLTIGDRQLYFAQVRRTFKGPLETDEWVVLTTPVSDATCGIVLNPGEYLINGRSAGTQFSLSALSVGLCDYNRPVAELTDEDRAFLDRRACGGGGS